MEMLVTKAILAGLVKTFDRVQDAYNERLARLSEEGVTEDSIHTFVNAHSRLRQCIDPAASIYPKFLIEDIHRRIASIVREAPLLEHIVSTEELDTLVQQARNMQKLRDLVVAKHLCSEAGCESMVPISLGAWLNLHSDIETVALVAENITCSACLEHICEMET